MQNDAGSLREALTDAVARSGKLDHLLPELSAPTPRKERGAAKRRAQLRRRRRRAAERREQIENATKSKGGEC